MNPIGGEPRSNRGVRGEGRIQNQPREGRQRSSLGRESVDTRRAVIDQFCDRLAHDFDETVLEIESILGVHPKTPTHSGKNLIE